MHVKCIIGGVCIAVRVWQACVCGRSRLNGSKRQNAKQKWEVVWGKRCVPLQRQCMCVCRNWRKQNRETENLIHRIYLPSMLLMFHCPVQSNWPRWCVQRINACGKRHVSKLCVRNKNAWGNSKTKTHMWGQVSSGVWRTNTTNQRQDPPR